MVTQIIIIGAVIWVAGAIPALIFLDDYRIANPGIWAVFWPLWAPFVIPTKIIKGSIWFLTEGLPKGMRGFARDFPKLLR